jgi:hypothetical protein
LLQQLLIVQFTSEIYVQVWEIRFTAICR